MHPDEWDSSVGGSGGALPLDPVPPHPAPDAPPDVATLADAVRRLGRASVTVVGDAMLDRYVYGTVSRISPEAPVPVLAVTRELAVPGGAGNVVRNLTALGAAVAFVSIVGDDQAGSDLTGLIGGQPNVEPWLLVQGARRTTQKTRFVARGQQLMRSDREDTNPVHPKLAERMLRIVGDALAATTVTVLSDYGKGVLGGGTAAQVIAMAHGIGRRVISDPHGTDVAAHAGADVLCPTGAELCALAGLPADAPPAALGRAAAELRERHGFGAVAVNCGADGLVLADAEGVLALPAQVPRAFDTAAACDTLVAALAAGLAAGLELRVAVRVANLAAGVVLGQAGLAVAQEADLLDALLPAGHLPRKVVRPEAAAEQVERWRRMGWRTGFVSMGAEGGLDAHREADLRLLERARGACDRLVVALSATVEGTDLPQDAASGALAGALALAGLPEVDLVCLHLPGDAAGALRAIRPELLVTHHPAAAVETVREWGGEVLPAE